MECWWSMIRLHDSPVFVKVEHSNGILYWPSLSTKYSIWFAMAPLSRTVSSADTVYLRPTQLSTLSQCKRGWLKSMMNRPNLLSCECSSRPPRSRRTCLCVWIWSSICWVLFPWVFHWDMMALSSAVVKFRALSNRPIKENKKNLEEG